MKLKKFFIAEVIFIAGLLAALFIVTAPSQIYPLQGMSILEPDFNFEIENGQAVLLSIDENFTNPIQLKVGEKIVLPPGVYYWKVKGKFRESEIRNFTVQSSVALDLIKKNNSYELRNSGNVPLNVSNSSGMAFIFPRGASKKIGKSNSTYIGGQI